MEGEVSEFHAEKVQEMYSLIEDFLRMLSNRTEGNQTKVIKVSNDRSEVKMPEKRVEELVNEEEKLRLNLDKLKKDNFTRQISINVWQDTLKDRLNELKEAELQLDKIYNEIWSEREKFCREADKFNHEYGIFSDWWKTQMNFLSDLENLGKIKSEDKKCRQEIEKLEKEIEEIKNEIDAIKSKTQIAEVEVHSTGDSISVRAEATLKDLPKIPQKKKIILSEADDEIKEEEEGKLTGNDLYSMVDVEKVRKANRKRNCRKNFMGRVKTLLTN